MCQDWKATAVKTLSILVVSQPTAKHPIDFAVEDAEDDGANRHKNRKDSRLEDSVSNDDDDGNNDPLFSHTADRPKLMSREKHSLCFANKFLMLMTSYHKAKLHHHSLILCPPRPQVGMSVHPHELL
jgi:hypothetical protein